MNSPLKVQVMNALRTSQEKQEVIEEYGRLNGEIKENISLEFKQTLNKHDEQLRIIFEFYSSLGDHTNKKHMKCQSLIKLLTKANVISSNDV